MIEQTAILPSTYFGPIQFYTKYLIYQHCITDIHEHYRKQTYRNRCVVYGANGAHALTIPVKKPFGNKTPMKEVQIDYDTNWQHNHFKAIDSAYRSSPFYEYYIDDFMFVFEERTERLIDLNSRIQQCLFELLEIQVPIHCSETYLNNEDLVDYRELLSPKTDLTSDTKFKSHVYPQVFEEKHGFIRNMSVLDLLFNEGPASFLYLQQCIKI